MPLLAAKGFWMFSVPTFLIGLREGLEASLVVSILIAYLVKSGRRDRLAPLWAGVAAAVVLSLAFGALLQLTSANMSFEAQEAFGGIASIVAVAFVTWMVFWMRRTARFLKRELHGKVDAALTLGPLALALTGLVAVGREGLETALFLWSAVQSTRSPGISTTSACVGLLASVAIAYGLYKGSVTLNLKTFFTWTGAALVVVAAGVFSYGVHDLQEAGVLPGLNTLAFDVSGAVPPSSWYGTLVKGIFNLQPATTVLQAVAYVGYLVPVLLLFFRPSRPSVPTTSPEQLASA
jgi:high-affinity iron transporter